MNRIALNYPTWFRLFNKLLVRGYLSVLDEYDIKVINSQNEAVLEFSDPKMRTMFILKWM